VKFEAGRASLAGALEIGQADNTSLCKTCGAGGGIG
jgi:hypothetical protein